MTCDAETRMMALMDAPSDEKGSRRWQGKAMEVTVV